MKIYNPYNRTSGGTNGGGNGGGFEYSAGDIYFGLNPPSNSVKLDGSLKSSNDFPELGNYFPALSITGNYEIQTDQSTLKNDYDIFDGLVDFQILKQIKYGNREYILYATEDKDSLIVDMTDKLNPVIIEQMNSNTSAFNPSPFWHMRGLANAIRQFTTFGTDKAYYTVVDSDLFKVSFYELDLITGVKTLLGDDFPILNPFNSVDEYGMIGYRSTRESFYFIPDFDNTEEFYILSVNNQYGAIEINKFNKITGDKTGIGFYEFPSDPDYSSFVLFYEGDIEKSINPNTKEFYFNIFEYNSIEEYDSIVKGFAKLSLDNPSNLEIIEEFDHSLDYMNCLPTIHKDDVYLVLIEDNIDLQNFEGTIEISGILKYNSSGKVYLNTPNTFYKSLDKTGYDVKIQIVKSVKIINDILFISTEVILEDTQNSYYEDFDETIGLNIGTGNIEYSDFFQFSGDLESNNTEFRLFNDFSITDFEKVVFTDNDSFSITDYDSDPVYLDFTYENLGENYILPKYTGDDKGFIKAYLII